MSTRWPPRIGGLGGGGQVPLGGDHFAPTIIVGNTLAGDPAFANPAPFQYIADIGDGAGISAAFTAAALAGDGAWVHIRRGVYDFSLGWGLYAFPLPIAGFKVTGDGDSTVLLMSLFNRALLVLTDVGAVAPQLSDLRITWTSAMKNSVGTAVIDASATFGALIDNVKVVNGFAAASNADEPLSSVFLMGAFSRVRDCIGLDIDGVVGQGLPLCVFRMVGDSGKVVACFATGANVGFRAEASSQTFLDCLADGAINVANHISVQIAASDARVQSCQMLVKTTMGVDVTAAGSAIIVGNDISAGGITIAAAAGASIVQGNRMNGTPLSVLSPLAEVSHNIL